MGIFYFVGRQNGQSWKWEIDLKNQPPIPHFQIRVDPTIPIPISTSILLSKRRQ